MTRASSDQRVGRPYHVWVAELSDEAGPRVHPDKPNLHAGVTAEDPPRQFARLREGRRRKNRVHRYGVALRPDLCEHLPSCLDLAAAKKAKGELIRELRRNGFVVNGNGRRYRVYVILLGDDVGSRQNPDKPWVYVGQTTKAIEARYEEHRRGARTSGGGRLFSGIVRKYGKGLLPKLYESIPCVYLREDALRLEKEVAGRLAAEGYSVKGGH